MVYHNSGSQQEGLVINSPLFKQNIYIIYSIQRSRQMDKLSGIINAEDVNKHMACVCGVTMFLLMSMLIVLLILSPEHSSSFRIEVAEQRILKTNSSLLSSSSSSSTTTTESILDMWRPVSELPRFIQISVLLSVVLIMIALIIMLIRYCIENSPEKKTDMDDIDDWETNSSSNETSSLVDSSKAVTVKPFLRRSSTSPISHRAYYADKQNDQRANSSSGKHTEFSFNVNASNVYI